MSTEEADLIVVTNEEAGERLDKILANRFSGIHSRTYFQMLIENERVLLNGETAIKRIKPQEGDEIQINFIITPEIELLPEPIPLDILYEDEHLIAVNKPAGLVVHPATGNWTGTFVNALLYHCKQLTGDSSTLRPGIVHRLDKDTTGVLLAAKTSLTQQKLIEMFAARQIKKGYLAICLGNPGDAKIEAPIGRHPVHRQRMAVVAEGRKALTLCKTLAFDGKISLVSIDLATGRTHQIRVHLQHYGTPILGDALYGNTAANERYGAKRQWLHAHRLEFKHPITGINLVIEAPIPDDMKAKVDLLLKK
jgi:23S rRNA pseudouridine1911/1915/1917 synthase